MLGRVRQQFYSCAVVSIIYAIWAGLSTQSAHTSAAGLMALFALSQSMICLGSNCTTFLLSAEVFPTRVRASAHGISAAVGESGAVLTAFAFGTVTKAIGLPGVLGLFSVTMAIATVLTLLIPETGGKSLADIEKGLHHRSFFSSWQREQQPEHNHAVGGISADESIRKFDGDSR